VTDAAGGAAASAASVATVTGCGFPAGASVSAVRDIVGRNRNDCTSTTLTGLLATAVIEVAAGTFSAFFFTLE
jgi:hypothetical protein